MHEECQGKTSSPPSWAIYTITLLKALKHFNPGATIVDVTGGNDVSRVANMFVDDCDMWTAISEQAAEEEPIKTLTRAAQAWERLLFASGGLLALQKCYWWMIAWEWEKGLLVAQPPSADRHQLRLTAGGDDAATPIKRLSLDNSNVGLGFRLAPSGNQCQEIRHRTALSDSIAMRLTSSALTLNEAWTFYNAIYMPKIFYPSKVTTFAQGEWEGVTRKFTHTIIRHMGFNCYMARKIVFGPRQLGGLGIDTGFSRQGAEATCHFLSHVRSRSVVGTLMMNSLSQLQLLSGQRRRLLSCPQPLPAGKPRKGSNVYRLHHLGIGWLLTLRDFLYRV